MALMDILILNNGYKQGSEKRVVNAQKGALNR